MRTPPRRLADQVLAGLLAAGGLAVVSLGVRSLARRIDVRRHRGRATTADAAFVMAAVDSHAAAVALGEVAGVRADHVEVRDFAQLLAEHHTGALTDLEEVAGYLGVGIDTQPPATIRRLAHRLQEGTGLAVDRMAIKQVLDDHRQIVPLYEEAAESAVSPELRAYAQAQLPSLRAHLRVAEDLARHLQEVSAR